LGLPAWVWLLVLTALAGSYYIGAPLSASFREAQTAMITRNLWRDGWSGLMMPRIDWFGNEPGYMLLEFPLYNALVAMAYAMGGVREWLGQIVSLACSMGAVLFLYGIARRTDGERVAVTTAALAALTPLQQFIGQSYLPEPLLMFCLLAALYTMLRYAEGGGAGWLALATLATTSGLLVKSPAALMLMLPLAFLAWTRDGWRVPLRPAIWTAAIVALGVYTAWQRHADHVNAQFYPYFVSTAPSHVLWNFGPLEMRWDWHFYARIAGRLFVYLSPVIVLAAVAALFKRPANPRAWLWHVWLAANVCYVLLCANLHFRHKHYQIVFVPIFAVLAARTVAAGWPRWRAAMVAGAALLVVYDVWVGRQMRRELQDPVVERACAALREVSAPQDLVVVAAFDGAGGMTGNLHNIPAWLYYADRRGWNAPMYERFDMAAVEQYRRQGARWLLLDLLTQPDGALNSMDHKTTGWSRMRALFGGAEKPQSRPDERMAQLAKELTGRYPCARAGGGEFIIFDLR
jgi:4-amino-4-deoxy-L-arabinose transferase-like glycosyltransferase